MKFSSQGYAQEAFFRRSRVKAFTPQSSNQNQFFKNLLAPMKPENFKHKVFEKKVFVGKPKKLELREIGLKELLRTKLSPRMVRLIDEESVELRQCSVKEILLRGGLNEFVYRRRGSVILNSLQTQLLEYASLAEKFQRAFGARASINAYVTPPDAQTLLRHWDAHDVFIFQISGEKKWKIFNPEFPLPLRNQHGLKKTASGLVKSVMLRPGEILYIPRGFPHEAMSHKETSFHLTVGLQSVRQHDLLKQLLIEALETCGAEMELRKSIYNDQIRSFRQTSRIQKEVFGVLEKHFFECPLDTILNKFEFDELSVLYKGRAGKRLVTNSTNTTCFQRTSLPILLEESEGTQKFRIVAGKVSKIFGPQFKKALKWIGERDDFSTGDLCRHGLTAQEAKFFVKEFQKLRLVREV